MYNLDDWEQAWIWMWADPRPVKGVTVQLHTLMLVTPGDFNLDGDVDAQDYAVWRSAYRLNGFSDADGNRDGNVDTADYVTWRDNPGASATPNQPFGVPEPDSVVIAFLALTWLRCSRFTTKRRLGENCLPAVAIRQLDAGQESLWNLAAWSASFIYARSLTPVTTVDNPIGLGYRPWRPAAAGASAAEEAQVGASRSPPC